MPHYTKYLLLLATFFALISCAVGPPQKSEVKSDVYDLSNAALIIGHISRGSFGTAITVKAVATDLTFTYKGATDFSMWLPEGEYEVTGIGSSGPFKRALTFRVEKGQLAYVGNLSYGCSQQSPIKEWYGRRNCGFLALSKQCTVAAAETPMCVFDDQKETIESFRTQHPEFASTPITSAVMK